MQSLGLFILKNICLIYFSSMCTGTCISCLLSQEIMNERILNWYNNGSECEVSIVPTDIWKNKYKKLPHWNKYKILIIKKINLSKLTSKY